MVLPQEPWGIWAPVLGAQDLIGCEDNIILSQGVWVHVMLHTMVDCDLQLAPTCNLHNQKIKPLHQGCLTLLRQHLNWHMVLCCHVTPHECMHAWVHVRLPVWVHVCAVEEPASTAVCTGTCGTG